MTAIKDFTEIKAWMLAKEFAIQIYAITSLGKFSLDFELSNQIRRASGSIMHNIAEGFDSGTNAEFIRFLTYSQRSVR